MNLEPKITFAKQEQIEVTVKTAQGWGKRIQLDIENLNQIGGGAEQTFLRGEQTFLSSEETLFSGEETLESGEDSFCN